MKDLRDFVKLLRDRGQLAVIDTPLDPTLEMTEVADRVVKAGGPALLFTKPKGFGIPVLMNQFGSDERMCLALRAGSYEELAGRIGKLTAMEAPETTWDKLRALSSRAW
jgi:4-hydroxy-3-polyprenylbenzoate decarboxylase